jgi:hypothetical protein
MTVESTAEIEVLGDSTGRQSDALLAFLKSEAGLYASVNRVGRPIAPTQLGDVANVIAVALGSGGAVSVLSGALSTWMTSQRSDVAISIKTSDREVVIDAKGVKDLEAVISAALASVE